jgi:hypothetical protein
MKENKRRLLQIRVYFNQTTVSDATLKLGTAELHLSQLMEKAKHPDMQKIRIIGFFFENRVY